jgi:polyhydroxyalkanoate synthesis regulator phasin
MKISINTIRKIILEEMVKISPSYQKKEDVKTELQELVKKYVQSGKINSDEELKAFWDSIDLSKTTLKMVPFNVWKKL